MLPISDVCLLNKYKILDVCKSDNLLDSNQINEEIKKPFAPPVDFTSSTITSFFMQERVVYGKSDIHEAWDIANLAETPVYAVCDGTVTDVKFPYSTNTIDKSGGAGNNITILCEVDDLTYYVLYGHLYPNSTTLNVGDTVSKGDQIASVGTTGYSTGNHLHFQVSLNNSKVDGMSLIDFTYENDKIKPSYNFNKPDVPSFNN
jgi:murein DD-endopeptidase MepM/ murein hydrolase activator NlpD